MADDKDKHDARDRATVSGSEAYEIGYFAEKHGITRREAQALIDRVGNSRVALEAAIAEKSNPSAAKTLRRGRRSGVAKDDRAVEKSTKARRSPARKKSVTSRVADATAPVTAAMTAAAELVEPVGKTLAPAKRRVAAVGRTVSTTARRGARFVRTTALDAPKTIRKRADAALDGAKTAATRRAASLVGAAAVGLVTGLAVNLGRKMVVQAPSALAGDWLDALKLEHKLALVLFDRIQETENSESAQRSALLIQLKHALSKHAFTEENVIYPALRSWGDTADADKLNHDHGYVKQFLYDLEEIDNTTPAFLEKLAALRAELEAHIQEEETIFPPLHASLGASGYAKLTTQANKEGFKLA